MTVALWVTNLAAVAMTLGWLVTYVVRFRFGRTAHDRAVLAVRAAVTLMCLAAIARRVGVEWADHAITAAFVAIATAYGWNWAQLIKALRGRPVEPPWHPAEPR